MQGAANSTGSETRGLRRKAVLLASFLVAAVLILNAFFGERGYLHVLDQRRRATELQREIEALHVENNRLRGEIVALRTDPRAIERLAREELGLTSPGETEYLLREANP